MISIEVCKKNNSIVSIKSKGHSGYSKENYDIVCAGVSAIMQTAILGLELKIGKDKFLWRIDKNKSEILIEVNHLSDGDKNISDIILDTLYEGLKSIELSYSRYVKINLEDK